MGRITAMQIEWPRLLLSEAKKNMELSHKYMKRKNTFNL
jgi:hypothetical protein